MITAAERRKIIAEHTRKRMSKIGRIKSPARRAASLANLQKANEARRAKQKPSDS